MTHPFRFAIQNGPLDDVEALGAYSRTVEELGYDELYTSDHIGGGKPDPFAPLIVAACATSRLRVGTLVLNNEFHHPALLARTALTVDQMTSGRLVLGVGTGYAQPEHDAIGSPLLPPPARVTRFHESITILRELLDSGRCNFDGEHHSVTIDDLGLPARQDRIPLLIGGHGRRVVDIAARFADIFQFTGLTHGEGGKISCTGFPMEHIAVRARWLDDAAGDRDIERSALVQFTSIGPDATSPEELTTTFGLDAGVFADTPFVLSGSLEQIIDKLERTRADVGISHYVVRDPEGFAPVVSALAGR